MSIKFCCLVLSGIFVFASISCTKRNEADNTRVRIWDCYNAQSPDSLQQAHNVTGSWRFLWREAPEAGQGYKRTIIKDLVMLQLTDSGNYVIMQNGQTLDEGVWNMRLEDGSRYGLQLIQTNGNRNNDWVGCVMVCDDELYIDDGYNDGSNYYFSRVR
jgi:hypothetical protein